MPFDPCNAGHTKCLDFELPGDTIINPSRPAPTDSYGYLVECLMEMVFRCFANITPDRCPAGCYQLTGGFITRTQAGAGKPFVMADPLHGGNGATFDSDGPTNQIIGNGDLPTNPVEIMETRYPVLIDKMELTATMDGAGKFRGGKGVRKNYRFLEDGYYVALVIENTSDVTSKGVDDGGNGRPGYFVFNPNTPNEQVYTQRIASMGPFPKGTVLEVVTGGGGGWGVAAERDPYMVLSDVRNGFLDPAAAKNVYGVSIVEENGEWSIDHEATKKARAA